MMQSDGAVRLAAIVAGLLLWQGVASIGLWPDYVLPGPGEVFQAAVTGIENGSLPRAVLVSLKRLVLGFALASLVGIALGVALGRVSILERTVGTLLVGLQSLPSICWMPLALLWFGLNESAILFVVVIASIGSVSLAVRDAVATIPAIWVRAARNMGDTGLRLWLRVLIPASLPGTLTALRIGWSFAWRALMAGELLFVAGGLGQFMHVGRELNDMAQVMAAMVVIVVLGLFFDNVLLARVEGRMRRRWGIAR